MASRALKRRLTTVLASVAVGACALSAIVDPVVHRVDSGRGGGTNPGS